MTGPARPAERIDKWLWQARFFRSRSLAARVVGQGLRINGERVARPAATVHPGDVLTLVQGGRVRVVEVLALGERRGPAAEAQTLYRDLTAAPTWESMRPSAP